MCLDTMSWPRINETETVVGYKVFRRVTRAYASKNSYLVAPTYPSGKNFYLPSKDNKNQPGWQCAGIYGNSRPFYILGFHFYPSIAEAKKGLWKHEKSHPEMVLAKVEAECIVAKGTQGNAEVWVAMRMRAMAIVAGKGAPRAAKRQRRRSRS